MTINQNNDKKSKQTEVIMDITNSVWRMVLAIKWAPRHSKILKRLRDSGNQPTAVGVLWGEYQWSTTLNAYAEINAKLKKRGLPFRLMPNDETSGKDRAGHKISLVRISS